MVSDIEHFATDKIREIPKNEIDFKKQLIRADSLLTNNGNHDKFVSEGKMDPKTWL